MIKLNRNSFAKTPRISRVGDTVRVHTKVVEGDKERIQIFAGVVIGKRGHGLNEMFTVRRISYGEGVERVFPLHSPRVDKVEVERKGACAAPSSPTCANASARAPRSYARKKKKPWPNQLPSKAGNQFKKARLRPRFSVSETTSSD